MEKRTVYTGPLLQKKLRYIPQKARRTQRVKALCSLCLSGTKYLTLGCIVLCLYHFYFFAAMRAQKQTSIGRETDGNLEWHIMYS